MATSTSTGSRSYYRYPAGFSRQELRHEVARVFNGRVEVMQTATGGSTTTVVASALGRYSDDYLNGASLYVVETTDGAAPMGEDVIVTDFVASTATLTVSPALSAAVESGDRFELYLLFPREQINNALKKTCIGAEAIATLTPSATTVDYALNDIDGLYAPGQVTGVWVRVANDNDILPRQIAGWFITDDKGVMTLRLPGLLSANDGLWISYLIGEDFLAYDDTLINLPIALARARTVVYLIDNFLAEQDATGLEKWGQLRRHWGDILLQEERKAARPPGHTKRVHWERRQRAIEQAALALGLTPNFGGSFTEYP